MRALLATLSVGMFMALPTAKAWVYSEHRDISVAAVLKLDAARRMQLDTIWKWARVGHEHRLPSSIVIGALPPRPNYIDWAAWPALAGDHSCSAAGMLQDVLSSDWVLDVARIAEQFKRSASVARDLPQRLNALRVQDIDLQRADPLYATRAGSNHVHFLLARKSMNTTLLEYLETCLAQGGEINAYAVYVWYHYRALAKAARLRDPSITDTQRSRLALAALADEAFAAHFLQDAYAAGHVTGTWGDASVRKGTHDYYNQRGYETYSWNDSLIVLLGDAHMRVEDTEAPAMAMKTSLAQVIDAFAGLEPYARHAFNDSEIRGLDLDDADTLNACSNNDIPGRVGHADLYPQLLEVMMLTPVPALKTGFGEMPRFRTELGGFIGISPNVCVAGWNDDFSPAGTSALGVGSVGLNLRIGLGLDGVMSESGDGLAFIEFGVANDNASTTTITTDSLPANIADQLYSLPARSSVATRIRMPYFLIPGDLILGGLLIAPFSETLFTQMAVTATNGGLLRWQSAIATSIGRFQFMLGREVGVQLYGFTSASQSIWVPYRNSENEQTAVRVQLRSVLVDAPIIEWRPFRYFSLDQHSSLAVQLCATADIPVTWSSDQTPLVGVDLDTRYGLSLRVAFDWRYYY